MSDGGEGLLEALGGAERTTVVAGPLGEPVEAEWRLLEERDGEGATAVVEMSRAAGRRPAGRGPAARTRCAPARRVSASCCWRPATLARTAS